MQTGGLTPQYLEWAGHVANLDRLGRVVPAGLTHEALLAVDMEALEQLGVGVGV